MRLKRAWSVEDVCNAKFSYVPFEGKWLEAFGSEVSDRGLWFAFGDSGNGKSSFMYQLAKEMGRIERVLVNDIEEGLDAPVQQAYRRIGMTSMKRRITLVSEDMGELAIRLERPKSPRVVMLNSAQYMDITFNQFLKDFKRKFPSKLFIVLSHVKGKLPDGNLANKLMRDASLKIWIEGHRAISKGRYFGPNGGIYDIWPEKAQEYYGI